MLNLLVKLYQILFDIKPIIYLKLLTNSTVNIQLQPINNTFNNNLLNGLDTYEYNDYLQLILHDKYLYNFINNLLISKSEITNHKYKFFIHDVLYFFVLYHNINNNLLNFHHFYRLQYKFDVRQLLNFLFQHYNEFISNYLITIYQQSIYCFKSIYHNTYYYDEIYKSSIIETYNDYINNNNKIIFNKEHQLYYSINYVNNELYYMLYTTNKNHFDLIIQNFLIKDSSNIIPIINLDKIKETYNLFCKEIRFNNNLFNKIKIQNEKLNMDFYIDQEINYLISYNFNTDIFFSNNYSIISTKNLKLKNILIFKMFYIYNNTCNLHIPNEFILDYNKQQYILDSFIVNKICFCKINNKWYSFNDMIVTYENINFINNYYITNNTISLLKYKLNYDI